MGRREFSSEKSSKMQNHFCTTISEFNAPDKGYLVVCALLSLSALFHNIRHIIAELGDNLVEKPIRIFTVFIGLVRVLYCFWWIRSFWTNKAQRHLQQFMGQIWMSQQSFSKYSRKNMWLICLILVAVTVLGVCLLGEKLWKPDNCSDLLKTNFNTLLKDTAMLPNETFTGESAPVSSCSFGISALHLFLQCCFATLVFVLALSALQFCKGQMSKVVAANMAVTIIGNNMMSQLHLEAVFKKSADDIRDYFQYLNQFASGFFLAWFSMVVPKLSYSVIESVPGVHNVHPFRIFHNRIVIVLYGFALLTCAEVRRQGEYGNDEGLLATAPGEDHEWYVKQFLGGAPLIL
ncbi:unnamed protein product [Orchesella dallaii]|uniref:Transmembrane protein n=1 Tax=Orchesella dallaii TaxID=48710 RepID=A0ABP1R4W1_9HEXA